MLAAFLFAYAGLTGLCLAMDRHHRQIRQEIPARSMAKAFRTSGWALLAVSLLVSLAQPGWSIGLVEWCGALAAAALALVVVVSYLSRFAVPAAIVTLLLAASALALSPI